MMDGMPTVTAIGAFGTLLGAWIVYRTLRADHEWRRRENAIMFLRKWNDDTADHAKAIEEVFPHLRDVDHNSGAVTELTQEQARQIYTCGPENRKYWELRFHIVELLNHLEAITTAYDNQVVDRKIVRPVMSGPLFTWCTILKNFLKVVEDCEGVQPWQPLLTTVESWGQNKTRPS